MSRVAHDVRALVEELMRTAESAHEKALTAGREREQALTAAREADRTASAAETARQVEQAEGRVRVREREAGMAGLSRLLDSIRLLDGAATLTDVLDALARGAAREVSRAAVLIVRHDRLFGWKMTGFGAADAQPRSVDLGVAEDNVVSVAVRTARSATTRDAGAKAPPFATLPSGRLGLGVPVMVGGRAVAVIYCDGGAVSAQEDETPSSWPEVVEVLARHTSRCLEALTVQKTTSAAAPRFWMQASSRPGVTA
jgi:hypothetical protein